MKKLFFLPLLLALAAAAWGMTLDTSLYWKTNDVRGVFIHGSRLEGVPSPHTGGAWDSVTDVPCSGTYTGNADSIVYSISRKTDSRYLTDSTLRNKALLTKTMAGGAFADTVQNIVWQDFQMRITIYQMYGGAVVDSYACPNPWGVGRTLGYGLCQSQIGAYHTDSIAPTVDTLNYPIFQLVPINPHKWQWRRTVSDPIRWAQADSFSSPIITLAIKMYDSLARKTVIGICGYQQDATGMIGANINKYWYLRNAANHADQNYVYGNFLSNCQRSWPMYLLSCVGEQDVADGTTTFAQYVGAFKDIDTSWIKGDLGYRPYYLIFPIAMRQKNDDETAKISMAQRALCNDTVRFNAAESYDQRYMNSYWDKYSGVAYEHLSTRAHINIGNRAGLVAAYLANQTIDNGYRGPRMLSDSAKARGVVTLKITCSRSATISKAPPTYFDMQNSIRLVTVSAPTTISADSLVLPFCDKYMGFTPYLLRYAYDNAIFNNDSAVVDSRGLPMEPFSIWDTVRTVNYPKAGTAWWQGTTSGDPATASNWLDTIDGSALAAAPDSTTCCIFTPTYNTRALVFTADTTTWGSLCVLSGFTQGFNTNGKNLKLYGSLDYRGTKLWLFTEGAKIKIMSDGDVYVTATSTSFTNGNWYLYGNGYFGGAETYAERLIDTLSLAYPGKMSNKAFNYLTAGFTPKYLKLNGGILRLANIFDCYAYDSTYYSAVAGSKVELQLGGKLNVFCKNTTAKNFYIPFGNTITDNDISTTTSLTLSYSKSAAGQCNLFFNDSLLLPFSAVRFYNTNATNGLYINTQSKKLTASLLSIGNLVDVAGVVRASFGASTLTLRPVQQSIENAYSNGAGYTGGTIFDTMGTSTWNITGNYSDSSNHTKIVGTSQLNFLAAGNITTRNINPAAYNVTFNPGATIRITPVDTFKIANNFTITTGKYTNVKPVIIGGNLTDNSTDTIAIDSARVTGNATFGAGSKPIIKLLTFTTCNSTLTNNSGITVPYRHPTTGPIAYDSAAVTYKTGAAITPLALTNSGCTWDSLRVAPALPAWATLNGTTGTITGTPTAAQAATQYIFTAYNNAATNTALDTVTITVTAAATKKRRGEYSQYPYKNDDYKQAAFRQRVYK